MKHSRLTLIGLASLCLSLSLTACGHKEVVPAFIPTPPATLLADCPETQVDIAVNADLVRKIEAGRTDLGNCNADKAALRTWADDINKPKAPAPAKPTRKKRFGIL